MRFGNLLGTLMSLADIQISAFQLDVLDDLVSSNSRPIAYLVVSSDTQCVKNRPVRYGRFKYLIYAILQSFPQACNMTNPNQSYRMWIQKKHSF